MTTVTLCEWTTVREGGVQQPRGAKASSFAQQALGNHCFPRAHSPSPILNTPESQNVG